MSTTKNISGTELKEKLLSGIEKLNLAVSSTLGPGGRTVLIREQNGEVKVTKDGVTVAKAFHKLEDDVEDLGAQLVKQVSIKSAIEAGDGTTTSTLLATEMVREGLKEIRQGSNAVEIKNSIDKTVKQVIEYIKKISIDIDSQEQVKQVATISGNEAEVGQIAADAMEAVGKDGVIFENCKFNNELLEIDTESSVTFLGFEEQQEEKKRDRVKELMEKRKQKDEQQKQTI